MANSSRRGRLSCFNGRLLYSCALIAFSQVNFGMDQGAFSNTQAMAAFKQMFGVYNEATGAYVLDTVYLSLLNSINYIGFAFGLLAGNLLSRRYGRRIALFIMCFWAIIAAIILVTSHHRAQMIVGRTVAYVYIGMELALVPVMQSELVPAEVRGLVVGTYQSGLMLGSLLMSVICRGTSEIQGHASWRIPLGLFFVIPSILSVGVWWVPESPRWLFTKGRTDEALESLRLLRQGPYTDEEIEAEFLEIKGSLDHRPEKGSPKEMFQGTNLKRTLISIGVNVFLQLTGQNFISKYGTIFIQSLQTVNAFTMSCVNSAVGIVVVFITQALVDRTGRVAPSFYRRPHSDRGLDGHGWSRYGGQPINQPKKRHCGYDDHLQRGLQSWMGPSLPRVAAEIPTTRLRDVTYALGSIINIIIQFVVTFTVPYLLDAPYAGLGSKVGFIFGSTSILACIFALFCVPEASGKTLEEIDRLFSENVSIRQFGKVRLDSLETNDSGEPLKD